MRSLLWFILVFGATEASEDEANRSNEVATFSDVTLADDIYEKQKVCDAYVGEAVVDAVEKGINIEFLVPNEKYLNCIKTLNEEKKKYIESAGVDSQSKNKFTMRLSDKRLVTLPSPSSGTISEVNPKFDTQQILCMTNKLCETLEKVAISDNDVEDLNEKNKYVARCWNYLEKVKREYIFEKGIQNNSHAEGKLSIVCIDGVVTLPLPVQKNSGSATSLIPMTSGKTKPNNKVSKNNAEKSQSAMADEIYDKQRECDNIVRDSVSKTLESGSSKKFPNSYFECKKILDEKKQAYISIALNGLEYHSDTFTVELSDKRLLSLTTPHDPKYSTEVNNDFDIEQELCITSKLCLELKEKEFSNTDGILDHKNKINRCLGLLDDLKLKYIKLKKTEKSEVKSEGFSVACTDGPVSFVLEEKKQDHDTASLPTPSEMSKTVSKIEKDEKPSDKKSVDSNESQVNDKLNIKIEHEEEKINKKPSQSEIFELADSIYEKQKVCDSILRETVTKTLDSDISNNIPVADERYLQCRKILDEKKKTYITTALLGMGYYSTIFPMILSNKRLVTLLVPHESYIPTQADADFDIDQELCITNEICMNLVNKKFSNILAEDINEQKKKVDRCLNTLNNLKLKYISVKKLEESELTKGKGLTLMCSEGSVTFALPRKLNQETVSDPKGTGMSKIEPKISSDQTPCKEKSIIEKNQSNEALMDLNSKPTIKAENEVKTSKIVPHENEHPTQEGDGLDKSSSTDKTNEEKEDLTLNDPSWDTDVCEKDEKETTKDPTLVGNSQSNDETKELPVKNSSTVKNDDKTKEKKLTEARPLNLNEGGNFDIVAYRTKFDMKNGEEKIEKIQASGRIKQIEKESSTSGQPELSAIIKSETETFYGINPERSLPSVPKKVYYENGKGKSTTLEENIIFMENDCNELLRFGENLMKHKMLSSVLNLEKRYDNCIKRLDALKKIYIEKHNLDVKSHENVFSMNLPSGDQRLVQIPKRLLTQTIETRLSTEIEPEDFSQLEDYFRMKEEFEDPIFQNREPFDDPVFISNAEFLESVRDGASDISTLSKVASLLHMSGTRDGRKISE